MILTRTFYHIAIDGYSGCGKSTLARDLAQVTGWLHLDTGAMYRAVSLFLLRHDIDVSDDEQVASAIEEIEIDFTSIDGHPVVRLNGHIAEPQIRDHRVSEIVSDVSVNATVRNRLVNQQQKMGLGQHIIADGRDIGTVVFPNAIVKLFITASESARVDRRFDELQQRGIPQSKETIRQNLLSRDHIDMNRQIGPLKKAEDAIEIDTTLLSREEQLERALMIIHEKTGLNFIP